jgi:hypothetical protein
VVIDAEFGMENHLILATVIGRGLNYLMEELIFEQNKTGCEKK